MVAILNPISIHAFLKLQSIHSYFVSLLLKHLKSLIVFAAAHVLLDLLLAHAPKGRSTCHLSDFVIAGAVVARDVIAHIKQIWRSVCALLFTCFAHAFVRAKRIAAISVTVVGAAWGAWCLATFHVEQFGLLWLTLLFLQI